MKTWHEVKRLLLPAILVYLLRHEMTDPSPATRTVRFSAVRGVSIYRAADGRFETLSGSRANRRSLGSGMQ